MNEKMELTIAQKVSMEVNTQLADAATMRALIATTFNGLNEQNVRKACVEAMMRGYTFQDILKKKIYAIPFSQGYSLVQSIADVRAIAMKSGYIGKSAPKFIMDGKNIISCEITVKRLVSGHVGDFTSEVYFDEYYKAGRNGKPSQWDIRPRTMIAKVAEMHALRSAFPEELAQSYVEEEFAKDTIPVVDERLEEAKQESTSLKLGNHIIKKDEKITKKQVEDDEIPIIQIDDIAESNEDQQQ